MQGGVSNPVPEGYRIYGCTFCRYCSSSMNLQSQLALTEHALWRSSTVGVVLFAEELNYRGGASC